MFRYYYCRVDKQVVVGKPSLLLRSRSSSANSGSGCTSPARSPRPRSPSPPGSLSNWSASVPALNADKHFENGHGEQQHTPEKSPHSRVIGGGKFERIYGKENRLEDRAEKPDKPEKPERRLNSKELIEKQKNWTSHFSKTRPSRLYYCYTIYIQTETLTDCTNLFMESWQKK